MKNNYKKISLYYKSTTPFTYIIFRWFILAIVVGLIAAGIYFWDNYDRLPVPPYIYVFIPLCILVVPLFLQTLINSVYFFVSPKILGKLLEKNWFLWLSTKLMSKSRLNKAEILHYVD
ncbi:hypothetical protein B5M19_02300 [Mesomycoplasma hyopneumoniae]|uniref:Uncharacterized protein n=2 Tax=Mesomycoplasma hyopneumoniae (strain 168) TaxID=907287 RepID=E4QSW8_MESH1|nr:hypothetical protein [Mesomycoplasma hyopneumoniae]ADQ90909.1 hypothetical protein MHP168_729 [Mesomycoplasma hyopneumoniae 168]AGM22094.1 hypothetical protein MHP168L_729 [Mesomycoplasma hyopneumoniae 168-L]OWY73867.1 hypothetical protein B5M19_02300 [Mesomycoplasma hyopneumoniae]